MANQSDTKIFEQEEQVVLKKQSQFREIMGRFAKNKHIVQI